MGLKKMIDSPSSSRYCVLNTFMILKNDRKVADFMFSSRIPYSFDSSKSCLFHRGILDILHLVDFHATTYSHPPLT